jgi:hypothetical protein
MRDCVLLALLAIMSFTVALEACAPRLRSRSRDDDDTASDDDDDGTPFDDDDDDDGTPPDDDDDDDGTPPDDDDATGDDDDVVPVDPAQVTFSADFDLDCLDAQCTLDVDFAVHYWIDLDADLLLCTQHLVGSGVAALGFGAAPECGNCTAGFSIDPSTWVDISDPSVDSAHCDIDALNASNNNYGEAWTAPAGSFEGAWGDFNQGAFLNAGVHAALGVQYASFGGLAAEELGATYEDLGLQYAGMIFWDGSIGGSSAEALAGSGLFFGEGDSDQFQPALAVYLDPGSNLLADPDEPTGWVGLHGASGTFQYNLQ